MRLRNFHKRIKKANEIAVNMTQSTATITTATITTANITTGNINVVIATSVGATNLDGSIITAEDKLIVPTTPYTGANVANGAFYATGLYMYLGRGGAWVSGLMG